MRRRAKLGKQTSVYYRNACSQNLLIGFHSAGVNAGGILSMQVLRMQSAVSCGSSHLSSHYNFKSKTVSFGKHIPIESAVRRSLN